MASANAPFIFFDVVSFCSIKEGVAGVTLSATRQIAGLPDKGTVLSDKVVTCHLRASMSAMRALRDTIQSIEELLAKQQLAAAGTAPSGGMMN